MSKRLILLLLTLAVAFAVIAAQCAAPAAEAPPAEEPAAEEEMAEEEMAEEPAEEEMAEEEMAEEPAAPAVEEITILWAQWDPADYLQQIGNMYEEETGVKVNIVQEPWPTFPDRFFTEMAAGGDAWDMVVGDSQWLGQGATQGHYVDMTDFLVGEGIADTVTEATLTYYGEYPTGSGNYWAFPTEGDADGWAYRKDLFENPDEMAAFEAEYGYPLDVPQTYEQFIDIAKFFTRPDEGLYGAAIYTQKDYDAITMGIENTMFSWGADWQDPETNEVLGIVNSPEAIEALEAYRELYDCCQPPGLSNAFFVEMNDAFISGQAAMAMNYFAFFPALASPEINPYAEDTGFFSNPAGPGGDRHAALGGQGMSVISYIDPERQEASKDFIRWFAQEDVQAKWAELGGYTCNANVLASQEFLEATPFNPAFAETMTFVKDFWNIPVYGELLEVAQREFHTYVVEGVGTAEEAMNNIAEEHDRILRDSGYIE
jgi:multiple sugar transport system substrate-binding protein